MSTRTLTSLLSNSIRIEWFAWIMDPDSNKVELWEPMKWDEKNKA